MTCVIIILDGTDERYSPLCTALNNLYRNTGCVDVAYYLIDRGYCSATTVDKQRLLCEASRWGKLDVVKKLVEKHSIHPIGTVMSIYV